MSSLPAGQCVLLKVQAPDGQSQTLEFKDISEAEAVRKMTSRGFRVLAVAVPHTAPQRHVGSSHVRLSVLLFSQELLALLEAGLNLPEALTTLHLKERQPNTRALLGDVLRALHEGRNFSDILARMPQHFPVVYVATVRAAERTGDLPEALKRYIVYQSQFDAIRKKLVAAAIYPAMLLLAGGMVTLFLLGYVVPRFASVYESSGRDVPWLSAILLAFGRYIHEHWHVALLTLIVIFSASVWCLCQAGGRAWLVARVLRFPWLAPRVDEFRLSRFYRAVGLLLSAGISLSRAMGMVVELLGRHQQAGLAQARLAVGRGESLSSALVRAGLAGAVAESLIKVGERSGKMAEMLERTASFADDDFARWIDAASRMLEPVLMLIIGLVIGTVVILMYMPIFELAGNLQ